jgi:hypothetical protein
MRTTVLLLILAIGILMLFDWLLSVKVLNLIWAELDD